MLNGGRISKALWNDIDRILYPEKWKRIDRKRKLKRIGRKRKLNSIKNFIFGFFNVNIKV